MKKKKQLNPYEQLEQWIVDGELGLRHLEIAYRASMRECKALPKGIRDILGGKTDSTGLIGRLFSCISGAMGSMELAWRRGYQEGYEDAMEGKPKCEQQP
jgi:hypothetical protein